METEASLSKKIVRRQSHIVPYLRVLSDIFKSIIGSLTLYQRQGPFISAAWRRSDQRRQRKLLLFS